MNGPYESLTPKGSNVCYGKIHIGGLDRYELQLCCNLRLVTGHRSFPTHPTPNPYLVESREGLVRVEDGDRLSNRRLLVRAQHGAVLKPARYEVRTPNTCEAPQHKPLFPIVQSQRLELGTMTNNGGE